jgi:hypothetical protein
MFRSLSLPLTSFQNPVCVSRSGGNVARCACREYIWTHHLLPLSSHPGVICLHCRGIPEPLASGRQPQWQADGMYASTHTFGAD